MTLISSSRLAELPGVPRAFAFEAPASWLCRAALSQGEAPSRLMRHLGLPWRHARTQDLDIQLMSTPARSALVEAGIFHRSCAALHIFGNLAKMDSRRELLMRTADGRPSYRYCPGCLTAQKTAHIEVHCRFIAWRACPIHRCMMESRCPHCTMPLVLPQNMILAGLNKEGVGSLDCCLGCGRSLRSVVPVDIRSLRLSGGDQLRLENGRGMMAILYRGRVPKAGWRGPALQKAKHYFMAATFWPEDAWHAAHDVRSKREAAGVP